MTADTWGSPLRTPTVDERLRVIRERLTAAEKLAAATAIRAARAERRARWALAGLIVLVFVILGAALIVLAWFLTGRGPA